MFAARTATFVNTNQRREAGAGTNPSYTWTVPVGVANINTTIKQFGTGSMWGNTGGGYIQSTTSSSAMAVGTGDFTVEGWLYVPTDRRNDRTADAIVNNATSGLGIRFGPSFNSTAANSLNHISVFARASTDGQAAAITWPRDQWNHWVVQRSGTGTAAAAITFWVNGTKLAITGGGNVIGTNFGTGNTTTVTIGNYNSGGLNEENLRGMYLDEIVVTKGFARYDTIGNIVVPTEPQYVDTLTGLLMHMDGTSGSTTFVNATS